MNQNHKTCKKGFTLTEVLVVVLIIGVMTAIAYPVYTKTINKSRAVEAINLLEMVRNKQTANFAREGSYLPNFKDIGQLTANKAAEVKSGSDGILTIGKYELAMNNATNCMSAAYIPTHAKTATFTFSSSYEEVGLGCDGDICKSFGNIVGNAKSVCNCGEQSCTGNFNLNEKTCNCDCYLDCNQDGKCFNKSQNQLTSQSCGYNNSGTQTRSCTASCSGGDCGGWGSCTGQSCNLSTKPNNSQACASGCGTQTRSVTCNNGTWVTGSWGGACSSPVQNQPTSQSCGGNGTQTRSCTASCSGGDCGGWGTCQCPVGYTLTGGTCQYSLMCPLGVMQKQSCAGYKVQTRTFQLTGWTGWSACI